jgi:hypothetical protein
MDSRISARAALAASTLLVCGVLSGCAAQRAGSSGAGATSTPQPTSPGGRIVKSQDGTFDGEIVGTPRPGGKFAKLKIGMTMREVNGLIGAPDDLVRHETGKRWIPFYFGDDAQRMQALVKNEGCLTYTGGNVFGGGGNQLIRIEVDPSGKCLE